ncbi:unnamed protein product [Hanseniaspora opuntiae]
MSSEPVHKKSKIRRMSEASNQQKVQKLNKDAEKDESKAEVKLPKWNSSSSSFLSSLSTHNSAGDDKHNTGNRGRKKETKKKTKKKKKHTGTHNQENSEYSIHYIKMESIQATFQTSKNNILQAYSIGNTHHKKGSNIKKYLSHKTYNEFKGETTIYDYVIEKRAFNRFLNKESESGIWWPTGAPCDVRIFYEAKKGMVVDSIKLFYVFTDDNGNLQTLDFKKYEDKHTSIFFLNRIFQSDHDLIPKMVNSLQNEAFFILQKTLISILKGWNVYLVCDLEFIDTCLEIYKHAHGSSFYYINRPMVRLVKVQSNLECKNCQGHASKTNVDANTQDIDSSIRKISLDNDSQEGDICCDESRNPETSSVTKAPTNVERSLTKNMETVNPRQLAYDFLSNLNKRK